MRNPVTFSVTFLPRFEKESKGKTPLYVRITYRGKRKLFSLQRKFTTALWDGKKCRLKGANHEAEQINKYLDGVYVDINEAYNQLRKEKKYISAESIKARYLGEDDINKTLLQLSQYHNSNMIAVLKTGTLKNYFTTEKYIKKFLQIERKAEDIALDHLNYAFIIDFENFLRKNVAQLQSRPLTNNGVMKHLERLKKLLNLAQKLEWVNKDPFIKFSLKFKKTEREYLTKMEIDEIMAFNALKGYLHKTKDVFIFACYTGLSYIDVKNLKKDHIVKGIDGNNWIFTSRKKTDQMVKIPLLDPARYIIDKYSNEMEAKKNLLPVISNQKINTYLKEIANTLKINKNLTFHCARHTFATTITLSNGVPIETVSKLLGHSKLSTTQVYARVLENRISHDIENLKNILQNQSTLKEKQA